MLIPKQCWKFNASKSWQLLTQRKQFRYFISILSWPALSPRTNSEMPSTLFTAASDALVVGAAATVAIAALRSGRSPIKTALGVEDEKDDPSSNMSGSDVAQKTSNGSSSSRGSKGTGKPSIKLPPKISAAAEIRDGKV